MEGTMSGAFKADPKVARFLPSYLLTQSVFGFGFVFFLLW